jgi:hypothetical protein
MSEPLTDEAVQSALASWATTDLAALAARLEGLLQATDRAWDEAMCNSETPPSLSFLLFSAVEALLELTRDADELARHAAAYDEGYVRLCRERLGLASTLGVSDDVTGARVTRREPGAESTRRR